MINVPTLRFELENLRQTVQAALVDHNEEFTKMISASIEQQLTPENLQGMIDKVVQELIRDAVLNCGKSYDLRESITALIEEKADSVIQLLLDADKKEKK